MSFDPPSNLEFEQHRAHNCGGGTCEPHQIIDRYWRRAEKCDEAPALLITGCCIGRAGRLRGSFLRWSNTGPAADRIGSIAAITSAASVTGVAPCLSRPLVPSLRGSNGDSGTAKTSRPCSAANRAVMSDPEQRAASTTTTPIERPEMRRLRRGKS